MIKKYFYPLLFFMLIAGPLAAMADSVGKIVEKGNEAYKNGKFDEALSEYEKAAKESPESARVFFNLGTAYYQKGEYEKAIEAFEKAALKSKDTGLEANSRFNLGNSRFRQAVQKKTSDLHNALETYGKSIKNYREALELTPDFIEAAENMEMARIRMKFVLDEIKKQEELSEKQNQEKQEAADQMQKLIEKQQQLKDKAEDVKNQMAQSRKGQNLEKKKEALAEDQQKLSGETKALANKLSGSQPEQPSTEHPSGSHLSNASEQQEMAAENLTKDQVGKALENQQQSIDELRKALDSLKNNRKKDQQQQQKPENGENKSIPMDYGQGEEQAIKPGKEAKEQGENAPEEKDAAAILDEERDNMKNRRHESAIGYKEVERDW